MTHPSERGNPSELPVREPGTGFLNEESIYRAKLAAAGSLPEGIALFRHTLPWPVDMRNPLAHITTYSGDEIYSSPEPGEYHLGIDIQVPLGTPILAPMDATLLITHSQNRSNNLRGLADVMLYSEDTGLIFWLVHLDKYSVPDRILEQRWFDKWHGQRIREGEMLGTAGQFFCDFTASQGYPELESGITIPPDVERVYGKTYDHLHFETHYEPNDFDLSMDTNKEINPLLLLKKLY